MPNATTNQNLAWDAVSGADTYDVERVNPAGGISEMTFSVISTVLSIPEAFEGLILGFTRNFRVRSVDSFGAGAYSPFIGVTLVGLPAPQNLRVE